MRLVLEENHSEDNRRVVMETLRDDLKANEVLELVHRAMLASGFTEQSIAKYLDLDKLYGEPEHVETRMLG